MVNGQNEQVQELQRAVDAVIRSINEFNQLIAESRNEGVGFVGLDGHARRLERDLEQAKQALENARNGQQGGRRKRKHRRRTNRRTSRGRKNRTRRR
jgi:hypothetical protein